MIFCVLFLTITNLSREEKTTLPLEYDVQLRQKNNYFFTKNSGLQNQSVLYVTSDLATPPRVLLDPKYAFSFAAALQAAQKGTAPILIRIDTKAGHGAGKPTSKRIEEATDSWAFLVKALQMQPQL
jgi:prolyl oligopeptidase